MRDQNTYLGTNWPKKQYLILWKTKGRRLSFEDIQYHFSWVFTAWFQWQYMRLFYKLSITQKITNMRSHGWFLLLQGGCQNVLHQLHFIQSMWLKQGNKSKDTTQIKLSKLSRKLRKLICKKLNQSLKSITLIFFKLLKTFGNMRELEVSIKVCFLI